MKPGPVALDVAGLPGPAPHYADAVVAGDFVFVSGLLPLDAGGALVGAGDAGAQAAQILVLLGEVLATVGSALEHVVKVTVFLTDIGERGAVTAARLAAFGAWRPASTLVEVSRLAVDGAVVEIDAVAMIP
jgi:enamine deaminase RidA (YjgF/YER057c/UK114 family)